MSQEHLLECSVLPPTAMICYFRGHFQHFLFNTIIQAGMQIEMGDGWNLWIKMKEKVESHQRVTQPNNNVIHSQLMKNKIKKLEWSGSLRSHKGGHQTLKVKPRCQDMYRVIWANHEMSLYTAAEISAFLFYEEEWAHEMTNLISFHQFSKPVGGKGEISLHGESREDEKTIVDKQIIFIHSLFHIVVGRLFYWSSRETTTVFEVVNKKKKQQHRVENRFFYLKRSGKITMKNLDKKREKKKWGKIVATSSPFADDWWRVVRLLIDGRISADLWIEARASERRQWLCQWIIIAIIVGWNNRWTEFAVWWSTVGAQGIWWECWRIWWAELEDILCWICQARSWVQWGISESIAVISETWGWNVWRWFDCIRWNRNCHWTILHNDCWRMCVRVRWNRWKAEASRAV